MTSEVIATLERLGRERQEAETQRMALMALTLSALKYAREQGHTPTELARATGLTRQTIYSLLKENSSSP